MTRLQKLKSEISNLSTNWSQAIDEVDGLLWKAHEILNSLNSSDWDILNSDLTKWNNDELRILTETIWWENDGKDYLKKNYTLYYIFTLTDNSTSSLILNDYIVNLLINNEISSLKLLDKMKIKIEKLRNNLYLNETEYNDWIERLNKMYRKASR